MEILKEACYLLEKYAKVCPNWIEGIGDCGHCEACRVFKCIDDIENYLQLKDSAVRMKQCPYGICSHKVKYGCVACSCYGR